LPTLSEATAREIAEVLAPYVAEVLARSSPKRPAGPDYDAATCAEFVRDLGQGVLNRAQNFFLLLATHGRVGSLDLALAIGTSTPRNIPANLTNSLKQRARRMNLDVPWGETVSEDGRTVWLDRDGIAARMIEALSAEQHRRHGR